MAISIPLIGRRKKGKDKPRVSINIRVLFPKIGKRGKSGGGGGSKG
jgi:hypothetical protein